MDAGILSSLIMINRDEFFLISVKTRPESTRVHTTFTFLIIIELLLLNASMLDQSQNGKFDFGIFY